MKSRKKYQRMWQKEIFRSRSKHPKLKKGIIGTTTLLGSASIAVNSTSVLAHAAEETVPTENKAEVTEQSATSGSITFETTTQSTVSNQTEPTEKGEQQIAEANAATEQKVVEDQATAGNADSNQLTETNEKTDTSNEETVQTSIGNEELSVTKLDEETGTLSADPDEQEQVKPNVEEDEKTSDLNDQEETENSTPKPDEEKPDPEPEKPEPVPELEEPEPEESKQEKPEPEAPAPEQPKPAEPEQEGPTTESEYEVIYVQQPVEQPVQEVVSEPTSEPIVIHSPENVVPVGPQQTTASHGSIKFDRNLTTTEFIEEIGEAARKIGQEEDLYASVMIAQAILESGSGGSQLAQAPNYNLFGIKGSYKGKSVIFATQEDTGGGNMTTIQASFRAYDDYEGCFEDYAKLLKEGISGNPDFYKGAWKTTTENYEEATAFLTGKYATDTSYNKKLNGLIETYNLTQYDHPKEEAEAANQVASSGYLLPLNDFVVSSSFGMRGSEFHRGIDLAAGEGMPIFASKAGTVLIAEYHYSWGNYVVIQHENGETTLYAHQRNFAVNAGEHVEQGQTIGFVGSTGNSTGSHLHFELCLDSTLAVERLVDPATVLF